LQSPITTQFGFSVDMEANSGSTSVNDTEKEHENPKTIVFISLTQLFSVI